MITAPGAPDRFPAHEPAPHYRLGELLKSLFPYPPRPGSASPPTPRHFDRHVTERSVRRPDPPQRPAHALLDEVPLVGWRRVRSATGQRQERLVAGHLVVQPQAGRAAQTPPRFTNSSLPSLAPLLTLRPGIRRAVEQVEAHRSQMPQLSKSRHQRSICAGVTSAGSSTNAAASAPHTSRSPRGRPRARGSARAAWPAPVYSPSTRRTPWAR